MVITLLGTIIATALLTTVTSRAVLGKSVTTGEAWRDARPQLLKLFGLTFLLLAHRRRRSSPSASLPGILVAAGGVDRRGRLARPLRRPRRAVVLAVWLMIRFSLASPALMLEKQGIRKSMGRSVEAGARLLVAGLRHPAARRDHRLHRRVDRRRSRSPSSAAALSGDGISGLLATGGTDTRLDFLDHQRHRRGDRLHDHLPDHARASPCSSTSTSASAARPSTSNWPAPPASRATATPRAPPRGADAVSLAGGVSS